MERVRHAQFVRGMHFEAFRLAPFETFTFLRCTNGRNHEYTSPMSQIRLHTHAQQRLVGHGPTLVQDICSQMVYSASVCSQTRKHPPAIPHNRQQVEISSLKDAVADEFGNVHSVSANEVNWRTRKGAEIRFFRTELSINLATHTLSMIHEIPRQTTE